MNYEQKYKEALKRAREIKSKILSSHLSTESCKAVSEYIDEIIPELKESEDERIRKALITLTKVPRKEIFEAEGITKEQALAWLEKQKDSLHIPEMCKENTDSFVDDIIEVRSFQRGLEEGKKQEREKQKEQKSIIQDVELNDAVYDYVRDHFIAGADFTPEYIKKLMENAFFAGVDYYLLKQESESCELQQPSLHEGLEEEIERFLASEESTTYVPSGKFTTSYKDPKKIARHFAQWGAENLKK